MGSHAPLRWGMGDKSRDSGVPRSLLGGRKDYHQATGKPVPRSLRERASDCNSATEYTVPIGQMKELGHQHPQSHAIQPVFPGIVTLFWPDMSNRPKRQLIKWQSHAQVTSHDVGFQEQPPQGLVTFPMLTPLTV